MREELSVITTKYMLAREEYEKFLSNNNLIANEITIDDNVKELSEPQPIDSSNDGFEESKALDIHALTFDFPEGADVSDTNARIFYDAMVHRREVYDAAMRYLIGTGQNVHVFDDIKDDIEDMENFYQNVLSKTHRIEPLEVTPEPGMERSLAPRIEEIENETDIVKNVVNKIDVESLDQEQAENQASIPGSRARGRKARPFRRPRPTTSPAGSSRRSFRSPLIRRSTANPSQSTGSCTASIIRPSPRGKPASPRSTRRSAPLTRGSPCSTTPRNLP